MQENIELRDWFAGMALQGILSASEEGLKRTGLLGQKDFTKAAVKLAFHLADEMMKAREAGSQDSQKQ